jgi:multisubunit Na+/H+ antiporter MnhF subunit
MNTVIAIAFLMLTVAILLGLVRLRRGPSVLDRILSFDLISTSVVGMIVLLSVAWHTTVFLEAVLIVSLLGFFTTVAFVFYLSRQRMSEMDGGTAGKEGFK